MELSDDQLVKQVAKGQMDALKELFLRHHQAVLRVVYPVIGDQHGAEDVVQETFLAILDHAGSYKPKGRFKAWLYKIAINIALMEKRRERHRAHVY